jgi:alpha 1,6-mannosyltransferase
MRISPRICLFICFFLACTIIQGVLFSYIFHKFNQIFIFEYINPTNLTNYKNGTIPHNIIQTGKQFSHYSYSRISFLKLNPTYSYLFYNDLQAKEFVHKHMSSEIIHAYDKLPMTVLKSDYFRYIAIYILGGIYSDLDTQCLRPIDKWTDNYTNVSFIVGVEAEGSPEKYGTARQLQLCQWTFASVPKHPILERMIHKIKEQTKILHNSSLNQQTVFNWTGPGIWTDVIFDYLKEKYNVEWSTLLQLKRGRLIGDIYIVPVAGFQPSAFYLGAKGRADKEARVWHYFAGSWKRQLPKPELQI